MVIIAIYPDLSKPPLFQKINFEGKVYVKVTQELLFFVAEKIELITEEGRITFETEKGVVAGVAIHFNVGFNKCKCIASLFYDLLKETNETTKYQGFFDFNQTGLRMLSNYSIEDDFAKRLILKDFFFELNEVTENV